MLKWTLPVVLAMPLFLAGCPTKKTEEAPTNPAMEAPTDGAPTDAAPPAEEAPPAEGH